MPFPCFDQSYMCFVVLQVMETNLVAFDCHWILINEVSAMEMIYGSRTGCAFSSPYCFNYPGDLCFLDPEHHLISLLSWLFKGDRIAQKSFLILLSHINSSNNTQKQYSKDFIFFYTRHLFGMEPLCVNKSFRVDNNDLGRIPLDERIFPGSKSVLVLTFFSFWINGADEH